MPSVDAGPSQSSTPTAPRSPQIALGKRTSSRNALRNTFRDSGSPPSTPPSNRRRPTKKGKDPVRHHARHEDQLTQERNARPAYDSGHSHGLSWSSTTRDSVVDNLLFSLDNLSRTNAGPANDMSRDREFDVEKYMFPSAPSAFTMGWAASQRPRGHTHSSSTSSRYDGHGAPESPSTQTPSTVGRRSYSASNFALRHTKAKPSTDTEKWEMSRPYIHENAGGKPSLDAGALENGRSSDVGIGKTGRNKRRSMSMDQIYAGVDVNGASMLDRGRPVPSVHSKFESGLDAAPEPMVANGPRKLENPTGTGPVYVNQVPSRAALRKVSTQTDLRSAGGSNAPVSQEVRNQASDFVRASSMRGVPPVPPIPNHASPMPSPGLQARKSSNPARERPGFFKRVFGGGAARTVSATTDRTESLEDGRPSVDPPRPSGSAGHPTRIEAQPPPPKEQTTGVSYPPVSLNKKPSSFFRRRKKSNSELPQPTPLQLNDSAKVKDTLVSPSISSLRQIMGPYLADSGLAAADKEDISRPATRDSWREDLDDLDIFHSGYTPPSASSAIRNAVFRESSIKSSLEQDESARMKIKLKKRTPGVLSSMSTRPLGDRATAIEPPAVSPLSQTSIDDKENRRPVSRASTSDEFIPARGGGTAKGSSEGRKFSAGNNVRKGSADPQHEGENSGSWFLSATASEERLPYELLPTVGGSRDTSKPGSAKSPALQPAASATLMAAARDASTPSTGFHSASSLPLATRQLDVNEAGPKSEGTDRVHASAALEEDEYRERARRIFQYDEEDVTKYDAASWMGENNVLSTRTRQAYMRLFDFSGMNILAALRALCAKLALRGETQQFDRIITALSERWCECNPNHGFRFEDVVHTIIYSLILLNTDLHLADIEEKMSRNAYVKNTLPTIVRVAADAAPTALDDTLRPNSHHLRPTLPWSDSSSSVPISPKLRPISPNDQGSIDQERTGLTKRLSVRPSFPRADSDGWNADSGPGSGSNALVNQPWMGSMRGWEIELENVLKSFFQSIRTDPLPLQGAPSANAAPGDRNLSAPNTLGLKRSGSIVSKSPSDNTSFRSKPGFRTMTMGLQSKYNRSRPKVYPASTLASSRTSFDDGNSVWSPVQSSNLSKYSVNKTLNSVSMQSLGQHFPPTVGDLKHSIGFANALSQAIIREESAGGNGSREGIDNDSASMVMPVGLLEDEALALEGAPWAKEGLVKHKHHLETTGRKAKERNWNDCFAVISKGKLTLFAFNTSTKSQSLGRKALSKQSHGGGGGGSVSGGRASSVAAPRVGGGDWMENAEQLDVLILRQTIASTLPPPGYSKTRPHVWALSLPSGAVHLFQVGTPEIAEEFMSTANYWSARLSKEPLAGGVSNIEYGWSDQVVNPALVERADSGHRSPPPPSINRQVGHMHTNSGGTRPSFQSSVRGSLDAGFGGRGRLPADKVQLAEWQPPAQSMMASQLMEVDQLKALTAYVSSQEEELEKHNELKHAIELAYSPRHANYNRAMANWRRKSDYLLREIVKFRTYIDNLTAAQKAKEDFLARRKPLSEGPTDGKINA